MTTTAEETKEFRNSFLVENSERECRNRNNEVQRQVERRLVTKGGVKGSV